jgi:hypothetical protein
MEYPIISIRKIPKKKKKRKKERKKRKEKKWNEKKRKEKKWKEKKRKEKRRGGKKGTNVLWQSKYMMLNPEGGPNHTNAKTYHALVQAGNDIPFLFFLFLSCFCSEPHFKSNFILFLDAINQTLEFHPAYHFKFW